MRGWTLGVGFSPLPPPYLPFTPPCLPPPFSERRALRARAKCSSLCLLPLFSPHSLLQLLFSLPPSSPSSRPSSPSSPTTLLPAGCPPPSCISICISLFVCDKRICLCPLGRWEYPRGLQLSRSFLSNHLQHPAFYQTMFSFIWGCKQSQRNGLCDIFKHAEVSFVDSQAVMPINYTKHRSMTIKTTCSIFFNLFSLRSKYVMFRRYVVIDMQFCSWRIVPLSYLKACK